LAAQDDDFLYQSRRPGQGMDPAFRRMVLGAGGVSVVVIAVALLWSGVRGTGFGPPPVISPPPGPIRVVPQNPGGLVVPEANVPILSGDNSVAPAQLAPPPATPDITQLDQAAGLVASAPASAPAPAATPPQLPAPVQATVAQESGPVSVQLAAVADAAGAATVWKALQAKMPGLLAGKQPEIVPAVVKGRSVWRLRLGGFASADAAKAFCAQVTAEGTSCMVAF
jgi:SPOR domain